MEVIYTLIPGMLLVGLAALAVLFWAARSGQFDDLEGDAQRLLMDEARRKDRRRFPDAEDGEGEGSARAGDEEETRWEGPPQDGPPRR